MQLSNRIKKIRDANNLTQEQVASNMGISASAYGQIERNASNSTYDTLSKIAIAMNVSILFLVDIDSKDFIEHK